MLYPVLQECECAQMSKKKKKSLSYFLNTTVTFYNDSVNPHPFQVNAGEVTAKHVQQ